MTGMYVTWRSDSATEDCFRVGSNSRCFCGQLFSAHTGKDKSCEKTGCKKFQFIPRRPEEVGMHWLPRRKDFNINKWRPSCKCKHSHEEHHPNRPMKCKKCACFGFQSDFVCIACDRPFEEHFTYFENEKERLAQGKPIRRDFYPLASHPEIQAETMKKLGIDGRTAEERLIAEIEEEKKESDDNVTSTGIPLRRG